MESISLPPVVGKSLQERYKSRGEADRAALVSSPPWKPPPLDVGPSPWAQGCSFWFWLCPILPWFVFMVQYLHCWAPLYDLLPWRGPWADISWGSPVMPRSSRHLSQLKRTMSSYAGVWTWRHIHGPEISKIASYQEDIWGQLPTPIFSASRGGCQGWGSGQTLCSSSLWHCWKTTRHDGYLDPEVLCCLIHVRDDPQHPNKHQDLCSQDLAQHTLNKFLWGRGKTYPQSPLPPTSWLAQHCSWILKHGFQEGFIASQKRKTNFLASPAEHPTHFANPLAVFVIYDYQ